MNLMLFPVTPDKMFQLSRVLNKIIMVMIKVTNIKWRMCLKKNKSKSRFTVLQWDKLTNLNLNIPLQKVQLPTKRLQFKTVKSYHTRANSNRLHQKPMGIQKIKLSRASTHMNTDHILRNMTSMGRRNNLVYKMSIKKYKWAEKPMYDCDKFIFKKQN